VARIKSGQKPIDDKKCRITPNLFSPVYYCSPGTTWVEVDPPEGSRLSQVAVGTAVVWAVTREGKVSLVR
jgi:hypothetical protein